MSLNQKGRAPSAALPFPERSPLLDQLDPKHGAIGGPTARPWADRTGGHEIDELADQARGGAVAGVTRSLVVAVDVGAFQKERGELRKAVPLIRAVPADVATPVVRRNLGVGED